jgi:hypothetical protein
LIPFRTEPQRAEEQPQRLSISVRMWTALSF